MYLVVGDDVDGVDGHCPPLSALIHQPRRDPIAPVLSHPWLQLYSFEALIEAMLALRVLT